LRIVLKLASLSIRTKPLFVILFTLFSLIIIRQICLFTNIIQSVSEKALKIKKKPNYLFLKRTNARSLPIITHFSLKF